MAEEGEESKQKAGKCEKDGGIEEGWGLRMFHDVIYFW